MPSRRNFRCLRAEVRLDDRRVSDDLLRCPLRDRAPFLQDEDPVGHAQDGPHHVLHDHGPEPDLRLHPLEHLDGVPHLIRGKARERLVEQEEAGPRREGAPELEPLLLLDGEGGSEGLRAGLELDEAEDSLDLFGKVRPFVHGGTPSERRGHEDVLPDGQAGEWLGDLVGLRDGRSDDAVRGKGVEPLSVEEDASGRRPHRAGEDVQEGRLPRAVRPDQAQDSPLVERQRHVVERGHPAEPLDDALCGEACGHSKYLRGSATYVRIVPTMPPGMKRAIRRTDTPMAIGSPWGRRRRRIWCGIRTITAPSIGPRTVPMPPMMIMASIVRETRRLKLSGNTPDTYHAKTAPAAPANPPLRI